MMSKQEIIDRIAKLEELKKVWYDDPDMILRLNIRIKTYESVLIGGSKEKPKQLSVIIEVA